MQSRTRELAGILLNERNYITVEEISQKMNLSIR